MSRYKIFTTTPWDRRSAAFYTLLAFVSAFYVAVFDYARIDAITADPKDAAILALSAASYCLPLFFILMLSRWVFVFVVPILFYIGAIGRMYTVDYFFNTTQKTAPLFFDNTAVSLFAKDPETAAFIGGMFAVGLAAGLVRFFFAKDSSVIRRGQAFAVMLIMAGAATTYVRENYKVYLPQPYAYIASVQKHLTEKAYYAVFQNNRKEVNITKTPTDNVTGLVIFIDKLSSDAKNNFTELDFISDKFQRNFGQERHNMLSALTGADNSTAEGILQYPTLLSVLNKAGVKTYWVSLTNKTSIPDSNVNELAKKEATSYLIKKSNGSPNPFLAVEDLSRFTKINNKGLFILSIDGSTPKISQRYNHIFKPQTMSGAANAETDYYRYVSSLEALMAEAEKPLLNRKSFIIIAGLNGEKITDNSDFISKEQTENLTSIIGIWFSPPLLKDIDMEKLNATLENNITPDSIFHTIIGCLGIETDNFNNEKNLCIFLQPTTPS